MRFLFLAAIFGMIALPGPRARAGPGPVFTLQDPRGDDHGDGTLRYPRDPHFAPGDLDLVSLTARPEKDGTLFEAVFARAIRKPSPEAIDAGGATLDRVARFGFYTLNVDIYVDTDRVAGSGRFDMLPGRRAEVDSSTAWERAIVLTPRPYDAVDELQRIRFRSAKDSLERTSPRVDEEVLVRAQSAIKAELDSTVYFPTRIRIAGPKIQFFVPGRFLGGPARDTWAYVVVVSGADMIQRFNLGASFLAEKEFSQGLMILPAGPGNPPDRLGGARENDDLQPPLMDVLIAPGVRQEDVLKDYDRQTGRPARLRGAVPSEMPR